MLDEIVVEVRDNGQVLFSFRAGDRPRPVVEPPAAQIPDLVAALMLALTHLTRLEDPQ